SGPFAVATVPFKDGIVTYFKHVNSIGGIHGRKVKMILEDDRYAIPPAIAAFKKLVFKDQMFATFGPSQTGAVAALFSQIEKERLVTFPPGHSERLITPHKRYIFMPGASYADQIKVIFDYIMGKSKTEEPRIAIVRFDLEYGKVGLNAAEKRAKFYNTKLVSDVILAPGALEATSQVLTLKRDKASCVILHGNPSMAVSILRDARKLGFKARFIGTLGCTDNTVVEMAGKAAESYIGTHYFASWYDDVPGIERIKEVTRTYYPDTKPRSQFYTMGWSVANIFKEGLERAGGNLTSETFVNALEGLKDFDTQGICGPVTYTGTSHKPNEYSKFFRADVDKGRLVSFPDWLKPVH
ncbi:MAG: ABC transporter substrate-binding protein, partial [Pseudomonadota bacterium]